MEKNQIRRAAVGDIPSLVLHHRLMFEEIYKIINYEIPISQYDEMDKSYTQKLQKQLPSEICKAWILEKDDKVISSGAVSFISKVPMPEDASDEVAYIHSIYTDKNYRNNGHAKVITKTIVDHCKSEGILRIELNSSNAGKTIYENIGFESVDFRMELWTDEL